MGRTTPAFYIGSWFVPEVQLPTGGQWLNPDPDEWAKETQNPEQLQIKPEDISLIPTDVQSGVQQWGNIDFHATPQVDCFYAVTLAVNDFYVVTAPSGDCFYLAERPI